MKVQISQRQLGFLAANSIIASSLVVLPQSIVDLSLQNAWTVPFFLFIYIVIIVKFSLFGINKLRTFHMQPRGMKTKVFALLMVIFISHILIRDLRILSGFIGTTLLPLTPSFVVTMLIIGCSLYMAWAGIEVIARFNELTFLIFICVVLFIPLSLVGEMDIENFEPVLGLKVIPSILQSTYIGLAWVGELIIVLLIIGTIHPLKSAKKTLIWGGGLGLGMFFILLFTQIAVLGAEIVRYSSYPTYSLVQQIRLTEFLDRLDFVLVSLYFPTIFAKFALLFYGLNRSMNLLIKAENKITLIPLALLVGILSITLLENKSLLYEFQIDTWATLGLILEVLIVFTMFFMIRENLKKQL
ncbi:GerAB/ArcD/ProY family transporter [Bacillus solitudinis]|uniref:GerAB/ArcD/ProY family transporter n=1 Tax=Bacillus solitudinis TaxID=2014074 RepID=UPI000C246DB1|nr:endospore germination permease [Bacillus solitudinis]